MYTMVYNIYQINIDKKRSFLYLAIVTKKKYLFKDKIIF